jgi:hypothetical protein
MASSPNSKRAFMTGKQCALESGLTREKFSSDLDMLFEAALVAGNFSAALKAKELIGKERGFFKDSKGPPLWSLDTLSDDDLAKAVSVLEDQLSFSKNDDSTDV